MSRELRHDSTGVYRFKVAHKWIQEHPNWGRKVGDPQEEIKFVGPYGRKTVWQSWTPTKGEFTVEHQKLEIGMRDLGDGPTVPMLEWVTFEFKHYVDGEIQ